MNSEPALYRLASYPRPLSCRARSSNQGFEYKHFRLKLLKCIKQSKQSDFKNRQIPQLCKFNFDKNFPAKVFVLSSFFASLLEPFKPMLKPSFCSNQNLFYALSHSVPSMGNQKCKETGSRCSHLIMMQHMRLYHPKISSVC